MKDNRLGKHRTQCYRIVQAMLQAPIIDKNKITDDLVDARRAPATRPGAPKAGHQRQSDQPELSSQIMIDFLNASVAATA